MARVSETASYLGDGLYVDFRQVERDVHLFAHNGIEAYNEVFLDGSVLANFEDWLIQLKTRLAAEAQEPDG